VRNNNTHGGGTILLTVNEYFGGNVKSISFVSENGPATIGVMAKGEYEFGTSTKEIMTVVSGAMKVKLPGETAWKEFSAHDSFSVEANQKFFLTLDADCSYLCLYK
jgi:purine/pyrimidine-nucleoside phosphorylase